MYQKESQLVKASAKLAGDLSEAITRAPIIAAFDFSQGAVKVIKDKTTGSIHFPVITTPNLIFDPQQMMIALVTAETDNFTGLSLLSYPHI